MQCKNLRNESSILGIAAHLSGTLLEGGHGACAYRYGVVGVRVPPHAVHSRVIYWQELDQPDACTDRIRSDGKMTQCCGQAEEGLKRLYVIILE